MIGTRNGQFRVTVSGASLHPITRSQTGFTTMERESVVADARGSNNSESATDDELVETMLVGAAKLVGLLAWWALRFPLVSAPIVVALSGSALAGWRLGVVVAVVCAIGYGLWCYLDRESFHRVVWSPDPAVVAELVAIQTLLGACGHAARVNRAARRPNPGPDTAVSDHRRDQRRAGGADRDRPVRRGLAEAQRRAGRGVARPTGDDPLDDARRTADNRAPQRRAGRFRVACPGQPAPRQPIPLLRW